MVVAIPLAHCGIRWVLSSLAPRYGWSDGGPHVWNLAGLILVALSAALLFWVMVVGMSRIPERVRIALTPPFLVTRGPYRFTRNPMYIGELGLWLGWAIYFGSIAVLAGALLLWLAVNYVVLPREERALETAFGKQYRRYRQSVPRWVPRA